MSDPKTKAAAITQAWRVLSTRWPKRFAPARLDDVMRRTWERSLARCAIAAIVPAAEQLAASWQGPAPDAPDVAKAAVAYEARHLRVILPANAPAAIRARRDPLADARRFWVRRVDGYGQPFDQICYQLPHGGGLVGVGEHDVAQMDAGTLAWGWIEEPSSAASGQSTLAF